MATFKHFKLSLSINIVNTEKMTILYKDDYIKNFKLDLSINIVNTTGKIIMYYKDVYTYLTMKLNLQT